MLQCTNGEITPQEIINEVNTKGNLRSDGSVKMDVGYSPNNPLDLSTKEYSDLNKDNISSNTDEISLLNNVVQNLTSVSSNFSYSSTQVIEESPTKLLWNIASQSNKVNILELNDTNDTITFKRAGSFNFIEETVYSSVTNNPILVTSEIRDSLNETVFETKAFVLDIDIGETIVIRRTRRLVFVKSDLPKTLKLVTYADGEGMRIASTSYLLSSMTDEQLSHNELTGRDDGDCHPIGAITGLTGAINGSTLVGETA